MQSPTKENATADGSAEEHKGLYEQPLTVEGKRRRTSTQAYSVPTETKKQPKQYDGGSGVNFGDIATVEHFLTKHKADDLKALHRICFDRAGTKTEIKKNLRTFSGFAFRKDSEQYNRKKASMEKNSKGQLREYLTAFGLAVGGPKEEQVERLMDFFLEPTGSDEDGDVVAKPAPRKRTAAPIKAQAAKKPRRSVTKKSPKKRSKPKPVVNDDTSEDEEEELVLDDEESEKEQEESEKEEEEEEGEEAKLPPSEEDLRSLIKQLLKDSDLNTATANTLCKKVLDSFPDFDISKQTDFIKSTIEKELANF